MVPIDLVWFMVFNAAFDNISVILWRSVLLVEETAGTVASHRKKVDHIMVGIEYTSQ